MKSLVAHISSEIVRSDACVIVNIYKSAVVSACNVADDFVELNHVRGIYSRAYVGGVKKRKEIYVASHVFSEHSVYHFLIGCGEIFDSDLGAEIVDSKINGNNIGISAFVIMQLLRT